MLYFRALVHGLAHVAAGIAGAAARRSMSVPRAKVGRRCMQSWRDWTRRRGTHPPEDRNEFSALWRFVTRPAARFPSCSEPPSVRLRVPLKAGRWPPDRTMLHQRLEERFHAMMAAAFSKKCERCARAVI